MVWRCLRWSVGAASGSGERLAITAPKSLPAFYLCGLSSRRGKLADLVAHSTSRHRGRGRTARSPAARRGKGQATMQASEVPRAVAAAMSTASSLGLTVDDSILLHDSNKLT